MKYIAILLGVILMAVIIIYYSEQSCSGVQEGMSGNKKSDYKNTLSVPGFDKTQRSNGCTFAYCGGPITDMGDCIQKKDLILKKYLI